MSHQRQYYYCSVLYSRTDFSLFFRVDCTYTSSIGNIMCLYMQWLTGRKIKSKGVPSSAQQINRRRRRFAVKYNILCSKDLTRGKNRRRSRKSGLWHYIYRHPAATGPVHHGRPSNAHSRATRMRIWGASRRHAHTHEINAHRIIIVINNNASYYVVWRCL